MSEQIRIDALIAGEPAPEISWAFNGKPITGPPCVVVEKGLCRVQFVKNNVDLNDAGLYQITATNTCGTVTADAKAIVVREYKLFLITKVSLDENLVSS